MTSRILLLGMAALFAGQAFAIIDIDNLLDQQSATTGRRSSIISFDKKVILDRDMTNWLTPVLYKNGDYNVKDAAFMYQTCYGGGMLDDLRDNFGNINMALGSASRYDQVAWAPPTGSYWSEQVRPELTNNQYVDAFYQAYRTNPIGPVLGPNPPWKTNKGVDITEEAQWAWTRDGNQTRIDGATKYVAILWGGQADLDADVVDVNRMFGRLVNEWGALGANYKIKVLFGNGITDKDGVALPAAWNAKSATKSNLETAIAELSNELDANTQFVFYATGHGASHYVCTPERVSIVTPLTLGGVLNVKKGEIDGMTHDSDNVMQLKLNYETEGSAPISVYLGGSLVGVLQPGANEAVLNLDELLLRGDDWVFKPGGDLSANLYFGVDPGARGFVNYAEFTTGAIAGAVPEPATLAALGLGVALLARRRRK